MRSSRSADLSGRVAMVTGASTGIGRGTCQELARRGCRLVVVARRAELLAGLAAELAAELPAERADVTEVVIVPTDLARPASAAEVVQAAAARVDHVDILVNSAGGSRPLPVDASDEEWDESFAINFHAGRRLTQLLLPAMRERGYGRIINITGSSEATSMNAASPAKAAVHAWSKALSREVAADGITVNSIAPGRIHSEQIDLRLHPDPSARQEFIDANIPAGYFGEPSDVGHLVAFLSGELGRYITGEVIHVDGGMRRFAF